MKKTTPPVAVHCRVELADLHAHLYRVTLTLAQPVADQRVSLPVWIPGSYLVREFARHLQHLTARQGTRKVAVTQLDKCTWQVAARAGQPLTLGYEVYAFDNSVRTAWLDSTRGFFNATSLCLRADGLDGAPHTLEVVPSKAAPDWALATGLAPVKVNRRGFGTYRAADYDELADGPVEMGSFWSGSFTACGVPHRFVVAGAPAAFDGERLLVDTKKICEAEIRFWHGEQAGGQPAARKGGKRAAGRAEGGQPPFANYLFMLNAVDDGYGGLEHRNSTALICTRKDLPRQGEAKASEGYTTLLGLISHEYFHTWNVKRLRPAEFARYDYTQENYTQLLWFFEGFTSYYDDLLLRRAGLLDDAGYLKLLNKTINQVQQAPGRAVQSVAQASFDAWVKYYRQDENTANATISYYTKGALVALCFDLTLRAGAASGVSTGASLDTVMRTLWQRTGGGPMTEADFADALRAAGRRPYAPELAEWVHSTKELPLRELLSQHGVAVLDDPAQLAQRLGLRVSESNGIQVKTVLRGGAAEAAGLAAGDEWLGVEVGKQAWRLHKLDELPLYAGKAPRITVLVARDKRLLRLSLKLPPTATTWRLAVRDAAKVSAWLAPGDPAGS